MREEYYCTNLQERDYLLSNNFKFTFVKEIIDTKVTTVWKFKKDKALFEALAKYYK